MKMRTFYKKKKTTSFYKKKLPSVIYKKKSCLQIVIYKKTQFLGRIYTPGPRYSSSAFTYSPNMGPSHSAAPAMELSTMVVGGVAVAATGCSLRLKSWNTKLSHLNYWTSAHGSFQHCIGRNYLSTDANLKCNNSLKTRLTWSKASNKNSDQSGIGNGDSEQGNNDDLFLVFWKAAFVKRFWVFGTKRCSKMLWTHLGWEYPCQAQEL